MNLAVFACLLAVAGASSAVQACSCPIETPEKAFQSAAAVFVAKLTTARFVPQPDMTEYQYGTETASFIIEKSLKGPQRAGAVVTFETEIGVGLCGKSARNTPPWLEHLDVTTGTSTPATFEPVWLLFVQGEQPYSLSLCSRSSPLQVQGASDLERIQKLLLPRPAPNPSVKGTATSGLRPLAAAPYVER
jgi:hypothetical protein